MKSKIYNALDSNRGMRITIDTQQDSKEHILKAMEMIKKLIGEESTYSVPEGNVMGMFNDDTPSPEPKTDETVRPYEY